MPPRPAREDDLPGGPPSATGADYAEAVLALVEAIPPGRVLSYGDVAGVLGAGGPRQVGRVLSLHGGAVPWWRVTRADGSPPPAHGVAALREWTAERTPLRSGRADMARARWSGPYPPLSGG